LFSDYLASFWEPGLSELFSVNQKNPKLGLGVTSAGVEAKHIFEWFLSIKKIYRYDY
jgi:hypothetical protein